MLKAKILYNGLFDELATERYRFGSGAQGETRTPTYISTLAPEASASTNSATWA